RCSATSKDSSDPPANCSKICCADGSAGSNGSAGSDNPKAARLGEPGDPLAESFRTRLEGRGQLDQGPEARFAAAALEQGDLCAVDVAEGRELLLGDRPHLAGRAQVRRKSVAPVQGGKSSVVEDRSSTDRTFQSRLRPRGSCHRMGPSSGPPGRGSC